MFAPGPPARLAAIFDWELATIGDPLADVGYLVATYAQPGDPQNIFTIGAVTTRPGFPTREQLIARYEARSGRAMGAVNWYAALALWKAAIFLEGSYKRLLAGTTDDPFFKLLDTGVPALAEHAWGVAHGE
jgi:aminoglycoside phosphotransferase (APT) family kinase protein